MMRMGDCKLLRVVSQTRDGYGPGEPRAPAARTFRSSKSANGAFGIVVEVLAGRPQLGLTPALAQNRRATRWPSILMRYGKAEKVACPLFVTPRTARHKDYNRCLRISRQVSTRWTFGCARG